MEQERQQWLTGLQAASAARTACSATRIVRVGDREAAGADLFQVERPDEANLLARAAQRRMVEYPERSRWKAMVITSRAATVTTTEGGAGRALSTAVRPDRALARGHHPPAEPP